MNVSGKTINSAPLPAASSIRAHTFSVVCARLKSTGLHCTAAATMGRSKVMMDPRWGLQRPGVDDERSSFAVEQDEIEHVQGIDWLDPFDERRFTVAVQGLEREAACVDLASFTHELLELTVDGQVSRK